MIRALVIALACAATAACSPADDVATKLSIEQQLASVQAGHLVDANDLTVKRFRYLLDSLARSTGQDDQVIADQVAKAVHLARDQFGRRVTHVELMEAANQSEAVRSRSVSLPEFLATYCALAGQ